MGKRVMNVTETEKVALAKFTQECVDRGGTPGFWHDPVWIVGVSDIIQMNPVDILMWLGSDEFVSVAFNVTENVGTRLEIR